MYILVSTISLFSVILEQQIKKRLVKLQELTRFYFPKEFSIKKILLMQKYTVGKKIKLRPMKPITLSLLVANNHF